MEVEKAEIKFHFTGFGKFRNVEKNPTTYIIEKLSETDTTGIDIGSLKVLDVNCPAVDDYVDEIYSSKIDSKERNIVIHLGVYSGSQCFNIETTGKNYCRSETMDGLINTEEDQSHEHKCCLPVGNLVERMLKSEWKVQSSDDAGGYLCNYIYYKSMQCAKEREIPCIFVHVPDVDIYDID